MKKNLFLSLNLHIPGSRACITGGFLLLCYAVLSRLLVAFSKNNFFMMMTWNAFLAFLPLVLASLCVFLFRAHHPVLCFFTAGVWLLFFPNSHYMITDFIHLGGMKFYEGGEYFYDIHKWIFLFHIAIGTVLSLIYGVVSMDMIWDCLKEKFGSYAAAAAILLICYLSGYAVYIGRFIRLNSWDILHPLSLLQTMTSQFSRFSLSFTFLMGTYILFTFMSYKFISYQKK